MFAPGSSEAVQASAPAQGPATQQDRGASLGGLLVEVGILSSEQLAKAQETALREGLPLWRVLLRDGLVMSRDLATLTALHLGLSMLDLRSQAIDPDTVALLPEPLARRYTVLPVKRDGDRLTVAMADPADLQLIQDLTVRTGCVLDPVVATPDDILEHIDIAYRLTEELTAGTSGQAAQGGGVTAGLLRDAPPAQVIDLLVAQAVHDRASDIHIEPGESRLRIRFRIDGILHDVMNLPLSVHPTLMSRLKIISGMNIAERRRPQDGQFSAESQGRKVDIRVAVSSTVTGEMAVLRLLDKKFTLRGLDQLGMNPEALEHYRKLLRLPYGIIIVCGPTGAGKSTTLYASILQMNRIEQNVISLEDPVEYRIADVNQMQIHAEAGITFANQLRSILRLDPDVIQVGEVRDQETATIAIQAALTGHLVLTSLHANDSVSALLRLRDLGVAPYLIASSVAGIVAQRMVREVCSGCRALTPRPLAEQKAYAAEMAGERREQFIYGSGCNRCAQTGYRGRTGVFEILTMTDALRQLYLADAPRHLLWEQALKDGMVSLRRGAMLKAKQGVTTPYEVMRVLFTLE
ncbi:MAG: ATPase, T2SS/T4P/T4SS family [Chloroflexota bacterium]|nr:ATPase, T2SS/T4P/T4SS family [Chloroflexota bacterium]